jgi:lysophospholipase L1-like esterase
MDEFIVLYRYKKTLRIFLISIGGLFVLVALLAGWLDLGSPDGFGRLLLLIIGVLVLITGLLGIKIKTFYLGTAIVLLNTLLLMAIMEVSAIAIARTGLVSTYKDTHIQRYLTLPYYSKQEWATEYWREAQLAESYRYEPYIVWRHRPFKGHLINIDNNGIRRTPGADCRPGALTVFIFGGSSMWGWGSPDWGTIPAYLQRGLDGYFDGPLCVVNLGEDAYVSTQGMVALLLQLQKGNIPDVVIFYDGINDVYAAYESGTAGAHPLLDPIAIRFEESENALIGIARGTKMYWLVKRVAQMTLGSATVSNLIPITGEDENERISQLTPEVVENYLGTYQVIAALANDYNFEKFFFWQPHLAVGNKNLTEDEQAIKAEINRSMAELAVAVYSQIQKASDQYERLYYIADTLDAHEYQIWIDSWGHITPEGNYIVAQSMLQVLADHLSVD